MNKDLNVYTHVHLEPGRKGRGRFSFKPEHRIHIQLTVPYSKDISGKCLNEEKVKKKVEELNLHIAEYFQDCWQDDDSPQYEETFGTCKLAA
jgi:hypothetical protein